MVMRMADGSFSLRGFGGIVVDPVIAPAGRKAVSISLAESL